jgi:hypothetical protein
MACFICYECIINTDTKELKITNNLCLFPNVISFAYQHLFATDPYRTVLFNVDPILIQTDLPFHKI